MTRCLLLYSFSICSVFVFLIQILQCLGTDILSYCHLNWTERHLNWRLTSPRIIFKMVIFFLAKESFSKVPKKQLIILFAMYPNSERPQLDRIKHTSSSPSQLYDCRCAGGLCGRCYKCRLLPLGKPIP